MGTTTTVPRVPASANSMAALLDRLRNVNERTEQQVSNIETLLEAIDDKTANFADSNKACGRDTGQLVSIRRLVTVTIMETLRATETVEATERALLEAR